MVASGKSKVFAFSGFIVALGAMVACSNSNQSRKDPPPGNTTAPVQTSSTGGGTTTTTTGATSSTNSSVTAPADNKAPEITGLSDKVVKFGESVRLEVEVVDPERDEITSVMFTSSSAKYPNQSLALTGTAGEKKKYLLVVNVAADAPSETVGANVTATDKWGKSMQKGFVMKVEGKAPPSALAKAAEAACNTIKDPILKIACLFAQNQVVK